ncbi:WD40 repeat domain-containing protein [Candidatus Poribacteria bacterium]|nr:WD40 repeat domain-containing protein [Candidatus Poribacteria bacterium]MYB66275.1 WD40 repeat domain-containing protein [Candidatus Poribacteria bacterium]
MKHFRLLMTSWLLVSLLLLNSFGQNETQIGLPENAIKRIGNGIFSHIAYSPDGKQLALAASIGIWIYDTDTYKPLSLLTGHSDTVRSVEYTADGKILASGSNDGTIRIWDPQTTKNIAVLTGHQNGVTHIAISGDSQTLASVGADEKFVRLWNLNTQKPIADLKGKFNDIRSLAYSPDSDIIAAGDFDGTVTLFSTKKKKRITSLVGHILAPSDITEPGSVLTLAFSPDGETLASGSRDTTIRLWDTKTTYHKVTLTGHSGSVTTLVFSPDGKTIASGASYTHWSADSSIRLWDAKTGKHLRTIVKPAFTRMLAFSPDNETLASINRSNAIHIWNTNTGELKVDLTKQRVKSKSKPISVFPDGKKEIYANNDGTYTLLDVETGHKKPFLKGFHFSTILFNSRSPLRQVFKYSPDGKTLAIQDGNSVRLWDIETDSHKATLLGNLDSILSIKFSPNGQFLSTAGRETIRLWNTQTGEQIATYTPDHRYHAHGFLPIFSPDSNLLATPTKDLNMVQIWNTDTGHPQFLFMGHRWNVRSVIFSPDGDNIVSNCSAIASLWDAKTGRLKASFISPERLRFSLRFTPDGSALVGYAKAPYEDRGDNRIWIWDTQTGQQKFILKEHKGRITRTLFAPDGKKLVSGSADGTMRFWDLETGELITTLEEYDPNSPIAFSPDGQTFASGGENAKILLWDLNTGKLKTTFTAYNPVRRISFEKDGKTLISSGTDGTILLWDLKETSK